MNFKQALIISDFQNGGPERPIPEPVMGNDCACQENE
jgi:hypothetical protein